jgi:hypothetical protein
LIANSAQIDGLAEAAGAADVALERWPEHRLAGGEGEEIAAIAAALREFETALTAADAPDSVLVASASSDALAAVIVATKVGTPVACVGVTGPDPGGTNARLIRQLADRDLAPEPAAIVDWVRDTYTERA